MENAENLSSKEVVDTTTATKKPRSEKTIKNQILTNVKKYLAGIAANREKETGVYKAPTKEEIAAECKIRWQKRIDLSKPKEDVSDYFD